MISFGLALMVQSVVVWCVVVVVVVVFGGGTASDKLMLHFPWCWYLLSSTHAYHFGDREHILRSQWCQKHFGKRLYLFWQVVIRWSSNFVWQWVLKIWTRSCIFKEYYCHWCVNSDLNFILGDLRMWFQWGVSIFCTVCIIPQLKPCSFVQVTLTFIQGPKCIRKVKVLIVTSA